MPAPSSKANSASSEATPLAANFLSLMTPSVDLFGANGFAPLQKQAAQMALVGVDAVESALRAWRHIIDASQSAIRAQQDIAFAALHAQLAETVPDGASTDAPSNAETLFAPMIAAAKAYEHVGEAVLQAQRGALEVLAQRPH